MSAAKLIREVSQGIRVRDNMMYVDRMVACGIGMPSIEKQCWQ